MNSSAESSAFQSRSLYFAQIHAKNCAQIIIAPTGFVPDVFVELMMAPIDVIDGTPRVREGRGEFFLQTFKFAVIESYRNLVDVAAKPLTYS